MSGSRGENAASPEDIRRYEEEVIQDYHVQAPEIKRAYHAKREAKIQSQLDHLARQIARQRRD